MHNAQTIPFLPPAILCVCSKLLETHPNKKQNMKIRFELKKSQMHSDRCVDGKTCR